jgi:hypothetical protein
VPSDRATPPPADGAEPHAETATLASDAKPAAAPAAPPSGRAYEAARLALATLLVAIVVLILGYLAVAVPGQWFPSASPVSWGYRDAALTRGSGAIDGDALLVDATPPGGTSLISINTDIRSSEYRAVAWHLANIPERADVRMYWRSDYAPARTNSVPVTVAAGGVLPVVVSGEPGWLGRITGIALGIRTPVPQAVVFHGVTAKPMGALEMLGDRAREWVRFEGWTGTSMSTITGGATVQDLPLPFLLAMAALLAAALSFALLRKAPHPSPIPIVVGTIFIAAWVLSDLRWEWNLARQALATREQYGGKDWRAKRLAAEDGPLFESMDKVRTSLPPPPARVFVVAESNYFRDRAAYHLYPHNVLFDPYRDTLPPSASLRAGDYLVVYLRRGVQYDPSARRLRFPDATTLAAELLLAERGAAVFAIK